MSLMYEIEPVAPGTDRPTAPGEIDATSGPVDRAHATVLIVDDEPAILDLMSEFLNIQGFRVVSAPSGIEALARFVNDRPHAVLLDVRMPQMDGIETLKRILTIDKTAQVLMVSGNDDVALAKEATALGAFDYILKPIDFAYLSRALDRMVHVRESAVPDSAAEAPLATELSPMTHYELALMVFGMTRQMPPATRRSIGSVLEQSALKLVREGPGGERRRLIRCLNDLRTLLRFGKDLGDITDDDHRHFESAIVRVRRSVGMA
jgi:DNA-binding response OmpR family regulator